MKRWFMTIPEACSLVLKAGGVGSSGSLYLLDMGEPVRIRDLAEQMIRFYGLEPDRDIRVEYVGLRPGERLGEKLWRNTETPAATGFDRILKVEGNAAPEVNLRALMERMKPVIRLDPAQPEKYRSAGALREMLKGIMEEGKAESGK
jgi:FlaA1/EpsC-like NDP-sugar epimerase